MGTEWPWTTAAVALAAPVALGHFCHLVLTINVLSGTGRSEDAMDRARACVFALFLGTGVLLPWGLGRSPWWSWPAPFRAYAALCAISGAIVWPLSTIYLALRRRPVGATPVDAEGEAVEPIALAAPECRHELIGEGRHAWLLRLPGNGSFHLRLREWNVQLPRLPENLSGLRIVQITDLHLAPCFQRLYFERALAACRDWEADLIVLTGDVVEHEDALDWVEPLLAPLEARLGKYAILGNHDHRNQPEAILAALVRAGFTTLEGEWRVLQVDKATVALGGTSAPWGPDVDPRAMPPADLRILLSHTPDRFPRAARLGIDLVLAGHNHGGQIRMPLIGAVFMPSIYSRRFDRGFFQRGESLMYVSEGVAGMHPVRFGCVPEITRFHLWPVQPSGANSKAETMRRSLLGPMGRPSRNVQMPKGASPGGGMETFTSTVQPRAGRWSSGSSQSA